MSPRPYRLDTRPEAVAEMRERMLATARDVLCEDGLQRAPIDEVARRTGIPLDVVHLQFESTLGLLDAVLGDFGYRAGQRALVEVVEREPTGTLLGATVRTSCRYWATDPTLAATIIGRAALDPAWHTVLARYDAVRAALLATAANRLQEAGLLSAGCAAERAADVLWVLTGFSACDQLTRGRGLTVDAAAELLTELAAAGLLRRQEAAVDDGRG